EVAEFGDGTVVVHWSADRSAAGVASTTVFHSLDDLLRVHGHEGRTHVNLVMDRGRVEQLERSAETLRASLDRAIKLLEAHDVSLPPEWRARVELPSGDTGRCDASAARVETRP